jgi:hypothetical protein
MTGCIDPLGDALIAVTLSLNEWRRERVKLAIKMVVVNFEDVLRHAP